MNDEPDLPEILNEAYAAATDVAEPSAGLRERTVAELRGRGLLARRTGRRRGAWLAAALVFLAFTTGYTLGNLGDRPPASAFDRFPTGDPSATTEFVQGAGTAYASALDALVLDLGGSSAADVHTARAVVRALTTAQSEALDRLLGPVGTGEEPDPAADASSEAPPPVIWF